jgi:hypothetical protein
MGMQASPRLCDIAIDDNVCLELLAKESCHTSTIFFHSGRSEISGIQFGSQILRAEQSTRPLTLPIAEPPSITIRRSPMWQIFAGYCDKATIRKYADELHAPRRVLPRGRPDHLGTSSQRRFNSTSIASWSTTTSNAATRAIAEWPHADAGAPRRPRGRRTAAAGLS